MLTVAHTGFPGRWGSSWARAAAASVSLPWSAGSSPEMKGLKWGPKVGNPKNTVGIFSIRNFETKAGMFLDNYAS